MQLSDERAAKVLQNRLAKFNIRLDDHDSGSLVTLLRAQGWKLTSREPSPDMLAAVEGVKFGEGSELHTPELVWQRMWEQS